MKIEFLKDNPEFINKIAELMFKEWGHLRENSKIDRYLNAINSRLNNTCIPLTIIAKSEKGDLIGFASIVEFDMEINKDLTPWISGVLVIPEYRGKGIGGQIIDRLEQIAIDLGYNKIYLFTFDKEAFYSNLSWIKIKNDSYQNLQVSIMTKELDNNK
jgi:GNAT superfamily N-acetyltransferase